MNTLPDAGEFRELLDAHCEGLITAEQSARLQACLLQDAGLRRHFVFCVQVQAATERSLAKLLPVAENIPISAVGPNPAAAATKPASAAPPASPVLGFLDGVVNYVTHSRPLMFSLISAALVGYFAIHFGAILLDRFSAQKAKVADVGDDPQRQPVGPKVYPQLTAGKMVARLTGAIDCNWQFPRRDGANRVAGPELIEFDVGTEFSAGQKLNLTTGLAELTFDSGAKVILHAPSQFAVSEALGGDLQLGKLTAKVPHSAKGFTINTPSGKVVDLGTEFGVKVNEDRTLHVVVYVGEVEVNSGSASGGKEPSPPMVVKAGEAIVVTHGQPVKSVAPTTERYVRDLAHVDDEAEAAYVEFVKKLKPALWLRMEGKQTDRVLHDEMGGPDAKLSWDGPGNPFVKGPVGKALWLRGESLRDGAVVADYPKAEHNKLTVAAWAYADSHRNWATIAKNWGEPGGKYGQFSLEQCCIDQDSYDLCARISQSDGALITAREGIDHPFPLYQWQHVAFVADGANLRLYRQGREVAAVKYAGLQYPARFKALGIGLRTPDEAKEHNADGGDFWSGKLDEVAVFNEALSPDDIKRLAGATPR